MLRLLKVRRYLDFLHCRLLRLTYDSFNLTNLVLCGIIIFVGKNPSGQRKGVDAFVALKKLEKRDYMPLAPIHGIWKTRQKSTKLTSSLNIYIYNSKGDFVYF